MPNDQVAGVRGSDATKPPGGSLRLVPGLVHLPLLGTAFFAVSYGVLRPAYDYFYQPFGLTTEQMGQSELSIVGHTAGYAASLLIILASTGVLGWLGVRLGRELSRGVREARWIKQLAARLEVRVIRGLQRRPRTVLVGLIASFLLIAGFTVYIVFQTLQRLQTSNLGSGNAGVAITLGSTLIFGGLTVGYFSIDILDLPRLSSNLKTLLRGLQYAVVAVVLIALATWSVDFWGAANRAGSALLAGDPVGADEYVLGYLSVNLSAAQVLPLGDADPLRLCDGDKITYAFGNGGDSIFVLVFEDADSNARGSVVRIPPALYAVATGLEDASPCLMPGE